MDPVEQMRMTILEVLKPLTVDKVIQVEKDLSTEDKISLYFLLNDDPKMTLRELRSGCEGVICEWCRKLDMKDVGEWKLRLIESLALMQLFKTLQRLGYKKRGLAEVRKILDMASRSRDFDVRKALYTALDTLTETELEQFIYQMDGGRVLRKPDYLFKPRHVELFLLEWQIDGKIGLETQSLNNVVYLLNYMNFTSAADSLRLSIVNLDTSDNLSEEDPTEELPTEMNSGNTSVDYYPIINPQRVGLCIVLNQKNYLSSSNHKVRRGSEKDCEKLKETMEIMNIEYTELNDLNTRDIFPRIQRSVRCYFDRNVHSVLIIVIMAHGDEKHIFGVDAGAVETEKIGEILSNAKMPCLKDKPKVIIFQSCRGDYHLDATKMEADGPEEVHKVKSWMDHYIICYSTISGFKSYRHPDEGSLYIQQLCQCLESMYKKHDFHSILMRVTRELYEEPNILKVGDHHVGMIPEAKMSLIKRLFLYQR